MKLLPGFTTFDDVFNNMFDEPFFDDSIKHMRTDVKEVDNNYILDMELPGFNKEDISIALNDGYLNIKAAKNTSQDEKDSQGNIIRQERYVGSCSRSFYVGEGIKQSDVSASYVNGELKITVPKTAIKQVETNSYIPID